VGGARRGRYPSGGARCGDRAERGAVAAGHASDPAVLLLGPDGGLEGESLLGCESLSVVGVILLDAYAYS